MLRYTCCSLASSESLASFRSSLFSFSSSSMCCCSASISSLHSPRLSKSIISTQIRLKSIEKLVKSTKKQPKVIGRREKSIKIRCEQGAVPLVGPRDLLREVVELLQDALQVVLQHGLRLPQGLRPRRCPETSPKWRFEAKKS